MKYRSALLATLMLASAPGFAGESKTAVFAGGCFWCVESDFEHVKGVSEAVSGYAGGRTENPTYDQVSDGGTGHREVAEITYDPDIVSYKQLLDVFWRSIDPLDARGQFCDKGEQYTSAIYYAGEEEKKLAEESKAEVEKTLNAKVATAILPAATFYPAEEYHQNYYKTHALKYSFYRSRCGRDARVKAIWGKAAH